MATLGEILREYRYSQTPRVTLDEMAARSGISKSYLSMLENNRFPRNKSPRPNTDTIVSLAASMEMSVDDLIERLDDDYPLIISKSGEQLERIAMYAKKIAEAQNKVIITEKEKSLILKYRQLSEADKKQINRQIDGLLLLSKDGGYE